jgi:hypothetical protein
VVVLGLVGIPEGVGKTVVEVLDSLNGLLLEILEADAKSLG